MSTRGYAVAAALVGWSGILLQGWLTITRVMAHGGSAFDGVVMLLGYFTVLTNLLVCAALTAPLIAPKSSAAAKAARPTVIAGLAVSIAFVAIAYHFLLRSLWQPEGLQWYADVLLHYVVPALYILFWFLHGRTGVLRWTHPLLFALYPLAYFLYAIVRGEIIHQYPYGFIDVSAIGYRQTWANAFGLLLGFVVLGEIFVGMDRIGRRSRALRVAP